MDSDYKSKGLGAGARHNRLAALLLGLMLASLPTAAQAKGSLQERLNLDKIDTAR